MGDGDTGDTSYVVVEDIKSQLVNSYKWLNLLDLQSSVPLIGEDGGGNGGGADWSRLLLISTSNLITLRNC